MNDDSIIMQYCFDSIKEYAKSINVSLDDIFDSLTYDDGYDDEEKYSVGELE